MDNHSGRDSLHKIVILNPKGGSGKTTVATNLASYFALNGPPPTLIDRDPLGYSMRWLHKRASDRPKIYGFDAHELPVQSADRPEAHAWSGSAQLIIDLPAGIPDDELYYHTVDADSILIPVMPSEIDTYSASRFIAALLLIAQFDRRNRNLGIVANRTRQNTRSYKMLMRFLTSLEIPIVAQLRDSQNYVFAAAEGIGIYEMPAYRVKQDLEQMDPLITWLEGWRMRKLDAAATSTYKHVAGAEILTPAMTR
ncbi:MAG: hypothetical protein WBM54_12470 [Woeseia sp.]